MNRARRAVIAVPDDLEVKIDKAYESARASNCRMRGVVLSTVGQPGTQRRHETKWLVPEATS